MVENIKRDSDIIETLTNQGFSEDVVREALKKTTLRRMEDIIDKIVEIENEKPSIPKSASKERLEDELLKRKKEQQRETEYKKTLLEQIKADRIERQEQLKTEKKDDSNILKSSKVEFGECTIKIRYDSGHKILHFKKKNTTADLFEVAKESFGLQSFKLHLMSPYTEIIPSERTLEETGLTPSSMLFLSESVE